MDCLFDHASSGVGEVYAIILVYAYEKWTRRVVRRFGNAHLDMELEQMPYCFGLGNIVGMALNTLVVPCYIPGDIIPSRVNLPQVQFDVRAFRFTPLVSRFVHLWCLTILPQCKRSGRSELHDVNPVTSENLCQAEKDFLRSVLFASTWQAALERGDVYQHPVTGNTLMKYKTKQTLLATLTNSIPSPPPAPSATVANAPFDHTRIRSVASVQIAAIYIAEQMLAKIASMLLLIFPLEHERVSDGKSRKTRARFATMVANLTREGIFRPHAATILRTSWFLTSQSCVYADSAEGALVTRPAVHAHTLLRNPLGPGIYIQHAHASALVGGLFVASSPVHPLRAAKCGVRTAIAMTPNLLLNLTVRPHASPVTLDGLVDALGFGLWIVQPSKWPACNSDLLLQPKESRPFPPAPTTKSRERSIYASLCLWVCGARLWNRPELASIRNTPVLRMMPTAGSADRSDGLQFSLLATFKGEAPATARYTQQYEAAVKRLLQAEMGSIQARYSGMFCVSLL